MDEDRIKHNIYLIENRIRELLSQIQSPGLLNGKCGVSLFYLYLWMYTKNEDYREMAINILEDSIENINFDNINFSLSTGLTGIAWTVEHFNRNGLIETNGAEVLGDLENDCFRVSLNLLRHENFDYLHGGLGYGIYCIEKPHSEEKIKTLSQIAQIIIEHSCTTSFGRTWEAKFNKRNANSVEYNLGISHGIPSIIYFLIKVQPFIKQNNFVEESITWLKSVFYKDNINSKIPERIIDGIKIPQVSKLAWCYGDLGVSTSLLYAMANQNNYNDFLSICLNTIKRINHEYLASMESGICHGVSGLAYMYNKLYNLSSNTSFKVASDKCFNFLLENENINSEDVSLLDGLSGIGLSYLSALSNKKASWDRVLLLS